jgi:hypothetical protein
MFAKFLNLIFGNPSVFFGIVLALFLGFIEVMLYEKYAAASPMKEMKANISVVALCAIAALLLILMPFACCYL